jgi:hypothetical protein
MGRLSTRSNPTSLLEIERRRVEIFVSLIGQTKYFTLQKLDLSELGISAANRVVCIARAGNTSQRFDLGSVATVRRDNIALTDLDASEPLRFRILVHEAGSPRLLASAENLRPRDEAESESLLPMEPAELGQLLWKLDFNTEGPVLKFNSTVFPNAAGVENYLPFAALVLPEAVRKIVERIVDQPDVLDDEGDPLSPWGNWIDSLAVERPNSVDDEDKEEWCNRVIESFCNRHSFATRLGIELSSGSTPND